MGRDFVAKFRASPPPAGDPTVARLGAAGRGAGLGGAARGGAQGRGRAGAAPPVRIPLTGWQEYAHALLLTNEAAFVH
jgi:hypothetical protein